jgi:hypothetical protein
MISQYAIQDHGLSHTMLANDDVKQDDAGLLPFDPIGRIEEWRAAMLADPSHTRESAMTMPSRFAE